MDNQPTKTTDESLPKRAKSRPARIDLVAFFVSLIAFAFAATWPWLTHQNDPKDSGVSITIEDESGRTGADALGAAAADAAIGFASRVKERLTTSDDPESDPADPEDDEEDLAEHDTQPIEKTARLEIENEPSLRDWFAPATIVLGVVGIGLGGLSMAYGSSRGLAYAAIGLGIAAVMIQILFILAAVIAGLILLMLLAPVLSAFST